jgi:hypothetical protein
MRIILFASVLLFLVACVSPQNSPSAEAPSKTAGKAPPDFGRAPTENAESDIERAMETMLKDPESAKYRFGMLYKAKSFKGLIRGGGYNYGWGMDFMVNAKNSFGGYTGFEAWQAFWSMEWCT